MGAILSSEISKNLASSRNSNANPSHGKNIAMMSWTHVSRTHKLQHLYANKKPLSLPGGQSISTAPPVCKVQRQQQQMRTRLPTCRLHPMSQAFPCFGLPNHSAAQRSFPFPLSLGRNTITERIHKKMEERCSQKAMRAFWLQCYPQTESIGMDAAAHPCFFLG